MTRIELEPVDRVRVTILMDNVTDVLIPSLQGRGRACAYSDNGDVI